ncbi:MAG: diguanylate cyclase [Pseudomonadota bacterium]|nr:diguanylate cyclase [Pseudomonadota bacterium]
MNVRGFSHYNLRAPRDMLETLQAFYVDVVGLRLGDRPPFDSFGYWLYAADKAVLHLSVGTTAPAASPRSAGFDHAAFDCSGRPDYENSLRRKGIAYAVAHVPQTQQVQLFFRDPAGNGVELNFAESPSLSGP